MNEETYKKLVRKTGQYRHEMSGGERYGIVVGIFTACDVLGVDFDTATFYHDINTEENRLYHGNY